jgi:hypothetical protein
VETGKKFRNLGGQIAMAPFQHLGHEFYIARCGSRVLFRVPSTRHHAFLGFDLPRRQESKKNARTGMKRPAHKPRLPIAPMKLNYFLFFKILAIDPARRQDVPPMPAPRSH